MLPGVVWLASYPKSGNTWFRLLLANWRRNTTQPADINTLVEPGEDMLQRESFDGSTLLCAGLLHRDEVERLRPRVDRWLAESLDEPCFVKVHDAYSHNADGEVVLGQNAARAAIYLVRDPRDVAVSFAAHAGMTIDLTIDTLLNHGAELAGPSLRQRRQLPQRLFTWNGHVGSWIRQQDVPMHIVRYEDLLADTARTFGQALEFLGESIDAERLARTVRQSRFSEVQQQEQDRGFRERVSPDSPFFRQGRSGGWRAVLTRDQARRIDDASREMMQHFGYLQATAAGND